MSKSKQLVREKYRDAVFRRDRYRCRGCGFLSSKQKAEIELDAHHITDRNLMPNGGYVAENGISLCKTCHEKAEVFHSTGTALEDWAPDDLYRLIQSNYDLAVEKSHLLR